VKKSKPSKTVQRYSMRREGKKEGGEETSLGVSSEADDEIV